MATYLRIYSVGGGTKEVQIKGSVTAEGHEDWLEIESLEWGGSARAKSAADDDEGENTDGDSASSQRYEEDGEGPARLTVRRRSGPGSCGLMNWFSNGEVYDVEIDCCKELAQPFLNINLQLARLVSFTSKLDGEAGGTDTVEMVFAAMHVDAKARDKTGQVLRQDAEATTKASTSVGDRLSRGFPPEERPEFDLGDIDPDLVREDRKLVIDPIAGVEFELRSLAGVERLSNPFRFRLEVASENEDVKATDLIGKPAAFRMIDEEGEDGIAPHRATAPCEFHGIVREVVAGERGTGSRSYTLHVVPEIWFLSKRTDCRIFQNKTVLQIVDEVFGYYKLSYQSVLKGSFPVMEYCVQYCESDLAFVHRLLEDAGIFYTHRHSKSGHKLVLGNSQNAYESCKPMFYDQNTELAGHLRKWRRRTQQVSGVARYRDYFHETSTNQLEVVKAVKTTLVPLANVSKYELYGYPGNYRDKTAGESVAELRIEAEEARHVQFEGTSTCDAFQAGNRFYVSEEESEGQACEPQGGEAFALTHVRHRAGDLGDDVKRRIWYENHFRCIPVKGVQFRPPRVTPRPRIEGPQTAEVVGAKGEEIEVDKYLSVKVKFRWDRSDAKDENASCWIRVAQPISGKNWGAVTIPRIGQEVVVEFLEGDPDRPLITGSLYNDANMPPYSLPDSKTQSVFKSRSSKEGTGDHFNELRFEDKKDEEQVYFHAEKNFDRVVEYHDTLSVGPELEEIKAEDKLEGAQTIQIKLDRTATVLNHDTLTVGPEFKDQKLEAEGKLEGGQTVRISKDRETTILNDDTLRIGKDKEGSLTVEVEKDRKVTVATGNDDLLVEEGAATIEAAKSIALKVGKNFIKIDTNAIELKFGESTIKLNDSGITIKGMKITAESDMNTEIKAGQDFKAEGAVNAQVKGSAMSSVEASGALNLKGGIVKIN